MSRPLRIEFEGAWYHVMNRGAGRRVTFPDDALRQCFLDLLDETHQRYGVEWHAYCLMGNHYHLMVRTPLANLGRVMRHVDGVYAQRHNRHLGTDGPLFRGRYRAKLVDEDGYLLQVGRYIHRNPIEARCRSNLEEYAWSSYPAYLGAAPAPPWLYTRFTLDQFGFDAPASRYRSFVECPDADGFGSVRLDDALPVVLGSESFHSDCAARAAPRVTDPELPDARRLCRPLAVGTVVERVSAELDLPPGEIYAPATPGARRARAFAMAICQADCGHTLSEIAAAFNVRSYFTVATTIRRLRESAARQPEMARCLERVRERIREQ